MPSEAQSWCWVSYLISLHLLYWGKVSGWIQSCLIWLVCLAWPQRSPVSASCILPGFYAGYACMLGFKHWSSHLQASHFIQQVISPVHKIQSLRQAPGNCGAQCHSVSSSMLLGGSGLYIQGSGLNTFPPHLWTLMCLWQEGDYLLRSHKQVLPPSERQKCKSDKDTVFSELHLFAARLWGLY